MTLGQVLALICYAILAPALVLLVVSVRMTLRNPESTRAESLFSIARGAVVVGAIVGAISWAINFFGDA